MTILVDQPVSSGLAQYDARPGGGDADLTGREQALLDFEATWWQADHPKDDEIRSRFGLSTPRYYQQLNALIDQPAALAYAPMLVKRLRRMREQRQQARSASRLTSLR